MNAIASIVQLQTSYVTNYKFASNTSEVNQKLDLNQKVKLISSRIVYSILLTKVLCKKFNPTFSIECKKIKEDKITFLKSPNRHKKFQTHLNVANYRITIIVNFKITQNQLMLITRDIVKFQDSLIFSSIYLDLVRTFLKVNSLCSFKAGLEPELLKEHYEAETKLKLPNIPEKKKIIKNEKENEQSLQKKLKQEQKKNENKLKRKEEKLKQKETQPKEVSYKKNKKLNIESSESNSPVSNKPIVKREIIMLSVDVEEFKQLINTGKYKKKK